MFLKDTSYLKYEFEKPSDFVEHLKKWLPQRSWFNDSEIVWNKKFRPFFAEILTVQGIGFTFNLAKAEQLINESTYEGKYLMENSFSICCDKEFQMTSRTRQQAITRF